MWPIWVRSIDILTQITTKVEEDHLPCNCKVLDEADGLLLGPESSWSICWWSWVQRCHWLSSKCFFWGNELQKRGKCIAGERTMRKSVIQSGHYVSGSMMKARSMPMIKENQDGCTKMPVQLCMPRGKVLLWWLWSPDGKKSAQVLFKVGKACNGYFSNEDILAQCQKAIDIVQESWTNEEHMFIIDNANSLLSACKMPKGIPRVGTN